VNFDGWDQADIYEYLHPYAGDCSKHGHWEGAMDECPECIEEDELQVEAYEAQHLANMGLCTHCQHADEDQHCHAPAWNKPGKHQLHTLNRSQGPKKHCKYFTEEAYDDTFDDYCEGDDDA
jgi:hypothetical protein